VIIAAIAGEKASPDHPARFLGSLRFAYAIGRKLSRETR
jgi:hypothetical protein